jgi:hypothetical protein
MLNRLITVLIVAVLSMPCAVFSRNRLDRMQKDQSSDGPTPVHLVESGGGAWRLRTVDGKPVKLWELQLAVEPSLSISRLRFAEQYPLFGGLAIGTGGIGLFLLAGGLYSMVYNRVADLPQGVNLDPTALPLLAGGIGITIGVIPFLVLAVIASKMLPGPGKARSIVEQYNSLISGLSSPPVTVSPLLFKNGTGFSIRITLPRL